MKYAEFAFYIFDSKSKCVCCNVVVQKRNRRDGRPRLAPSEENSATGSESEPEVIYGQAGRGL